MEDPKATSAAQSMWPVKVECFQFQAAPVVPCESMCARFLAHCACRGFATAPCLFVL